MSLGRQQDSLTASIGPSTLALEDDQHSKGIAFQSLEKEARFTLLSITSYPRKLQFAAQIELEGKKASSHPVLGPCAGVLWLTYFYFRYSSTDVKVFSGAVYNVTVGNKPVSVCRIHTKLCLALCQARRAGKVYDGSCLPEVYNLVGEKRSAHLTPYNKFHRW